MSCLATTGSPQHGYITVDDAHTAPTSPINNDNFVITHWQKKVLGWT
jgi:hypothetical protein